MHTEDEAKKMWCPHVRIGDDQGASASINRAWSRGCPDAANCIASKCMAWRWALSPEDAESEWNDDHQQPTGYCGLAGKP